MPFKPTPSEPALTEAEKERLAHCEQIIAVGIKKFFEVGVALWEIRDRKLWRGQGKSFADFVERKWGYAKTHAYRLVKQGQSYTALASFRAQSINRAAENSPAGENSEGLEFTLPETERGMRALDSIMDRAEKEAPKLNEPETRVKTMATILLKAGQMAGKGKISAPIIKRAAIRLRIISTDQKQKKAPTVRIPKVEHDSAMVTLRGLLAWLLEGEHPVQATQLEAALDNLEPDDASKDVQLLPPPQRLTNTNCHAGERIAG